MTFLVRDVRAPVTFHTPQAPHAMFLSGVTTADYELPAKSSDKVIHKRQAVTSTTTGSPKPAGTLEHSTRENRRTSSTQHRLFRQLVTESEEATYDDLLLRNDMRWLSKGNASGCFCALLEEVKGRGKTIADMVKKQESFTRKLELLVSDISTGRLLHFSTLKTQALGQVHVHHVDFIKQLRANFTFNLLRRDV
ncbi:hypothetical protein DPX16_0636 [Anabarilius grahami]|uniref:Uncharacterized protein n=1 Tax=Anabarilius grahami TaxID=495550 RepID=A0A3N0Y085_ANAGA|nr:hypothetical protein DPX16_0636 [Anabarilius grahami]